MMNSICVQAHRLTFLLLFFNSSCTFFFFLGRYAVGVINDIDDCVTETDIKKSYTAFKARFKKIKDYERVQFAAFKILGYNDNVVSCVYVYMYGVFNFFNLLIQMFGLLWLIESR